MVGESGAKPGWYPDPEGTARQRYWDGEHWTQHYNPAEVGNDTDAPEAHRASRRFGYGERSRRLAGIGGFVLAVSPFLTWANFVLLGGLNLFQLLRVTNGSTGVAWILLLLGLGIAIYAGRRAQIRKVRRLGKVAGVILVLYLGLVLIEANSATADTGGLASLGIGPFAAFIGAVLVLLAGFLQDPGLANKSAGGPPHPRVVPPLAPVERQEGVLCEQCSARIDADSRFCSECGAAQAVQ
jgi:Protein of unknown function (DUF2510)